MLTPDDLARISIVGTSCSGKTTLARQLKKVLNIPHVELDALNWLPNWQQRDKVEFQSLTSQAIKQKYWVVDGNYSHKVQEMIWAKATAVIWLNYSFPRTFYRAIKRTCARVITQEEMYSGNKENFKQAFMSKNSIIYWVATTYKRRSIQYPQKFKLPQNQHLKVMEFNHPHQTRFWLRELQKYKKY